MDEAGGRQQTLVELVEAKDRAKGAVLALKAEGASRETLKPAHQAYLRLHNAIQERKAFDAAAVFGLLDTAKTGRVGADSFAAAARRFGPPWLSPAATAALFDAITGPLPYLTREATKAWWLDVDPDNRPSEALKLAFHYTLHGGAPPPPHSLARPAIVATRAALKQKIAALKAARASTERILPVFLRYKDLSDHLASLPPDDPGASVRAPAGVGSPAPPRPPSPPLTPGGPSTGLTPPAPAPDDARCSLAVYYPYFVGLYAESVLSVAVKSIHLELLLRKLLQPGHDDAELLRIFLSTRCKTIRPSALLALLAERYDAVPAPELDADVYARETRAQVRNKVLGFVLSWLVGFAGDVAGEWEGEASDGVNTDAMAAYVRASGDARVVDVLVAWLEGVAERDGRSDELVFVLQYAQHKAAGAETEYTKQFAPRSFSQHIPPPIVPASLGQVTSVLAISPVELARQLTFEDYSVFYAIQPADYLAPTPTASMEAYSARFNMVREWASSQVLVAEGRDGRAVVICKLIDVASCCFQLDNFMSMQAILLALMFHPVERLTPTWAAVPGGHRAKLEEMQSIMNVMGRFEVFRMRLRGVSAPGVPFLGPFLGDIIGADEAWDTFVEPGRQVNIDKLSVMADRVRLMMRLRDPAIEYAIQPIAHIQDLFSAGKHLNEMQAREASYAAWPRGSKLTAKAARKIKPVAYADASFGEPSVSKAIYRHDADDDPLSRVPPALEYAVDPHGHRCTAPRQYDANVMYSSEQYPTPLAVALPPPFELPPLARLHPLEVARQLTLGDFDTFAAVDVEEYRAYVVDGAASGPHVGVEALLARFNGRIRWAASCVLAEEQGPCQRAWMICYLLEVAHGCILLNNFFSAAALTLGLDSPAVTRLAATSSVVPQWMREEVQAPLERYLAPDHSHRAYFSAIADLPPPLVPNPLFHLQIMSQEIQIECVGATRDEQRAFIEPRLRDLAAMSEFSYHLHPVEPIAELIDSILVRGEANVHFARSLMLENAGERTSEPPVGYTRVLANFPI